MNINLMCLRYCVQKVAEIYMKHLSRKHTQLLSAASMMPGILMAVYWIVRPPVKEPIKIVLSAYLYILLCIGSIAYHTHCAHHDTDNPRWLRLDITSQQIFIYITAILSPLGYSGGILVLPLAVITWLSNLSVISEYYAAIIAHAIAILAVSGIQKIFFGLQWSFAFLMYALKDYNPGYYIIFQTLWHVLCHVNVRSIWLYMSQSPIIV